MENTVNLKSSIAWSDFKLNSDGMVPVIAQDYQTNEVLMLAYMNEKAFNTTLETGKMTYWSRSRQELWLKGLTSGHFQYVKSLALDCDNDTILAKVDQIGAACHTGSRSCFFKPLVQKEYNDTNPLHIFQDVYDMIADHKIHPKEGSYTNYLFDKGIDKILKKVEKNLDRSNILRGSYMCQGKMPNSVRERYMKMKNSPLPVPNIDAMIENFDRAVSHPDEQDLEQLRQVIASSQK